MKRALVLLLVLCGCPQPENHVVEQLAKDYGEELFHDPHLSDTLFNNGFACSTCHATDPSDTRMLPGHSLAGVTRRFSENGFASAQHAPNNPAAGNIPSRPPQA